MSSPHTDSSFKGYNKLPGTTTFKSNYVFSPPKGQPLTYRSHMANNNKSNINVNKKLTYDEQFSRGQARRILKQSQHRIASSISMADLFKQNIDNRDYSQQRYNKILSSAVRTQELQMLHNEHRIQVEKLLLEISRLHDVIYEIERSKKYELQRLKQQYQQMTYLHLSNIKQSQLAQIQILEVQLKKTKDALALQGEQLQETQKIMTKEKQMFKNEIQTLRNSLKQLVNKKNEQLFQIRQQNQQKMKQIKKENCSAIQQMKQSCDQQIKRIQKQLQQKQDRITKLQEQHQQVHQKNTQLQYLIEKQRVGLEEKLKDHIEAGNNKYEKLVDHVQRIFRQQQQNQGTNEKLLRQIYESQIRNLLEIIKTKGDQNNRLLTQLEAERLQLKLLRQNTQQQNEYLKKIIKKLQLRNLQQIEQLKVRMAILHQNDIKELVKLYDSKIECLHQQLSRENDQTTRVRKYMHEETQRWYQNKKNYQNEVSKLNVEILRLKNGLGNIQKDMKQRLQSQRSAMLLTSKSLIRGVELKNTNVKFYEDELRKLRATIEKQSNDAEEVEAKLKQEILELQQEIRRLKDSFKAKQQQYVDSDQVLLKTIQDKDTQIKRLNKLANQLVAQNHVDESQELKQLKRTAHQLNQKLDQKANNIKDLIMKIQKLQRELQDVKIQNQQLYLQNQINHEQAKGEYQKISSQNMKSLKQFYERRILQLEADKKELKNKQSADQASLAQIIRKYQLLQSCMAKMTKQAKKRTKLEQRIMNLGMDNNLVKNKAELFEQPDDPHTE